MDDFTSFVIFTVICILCWFMGSCAGHSITESRQQTQAVEHGYAHWEISPDGSVAFAWNDEAVGETVKECLCSGCK